MDTNELLTNVSLRWECTDCKRKGLWFSEGSKVTTTNNGERHSEKFSHTTYMVQRRWGFVDGKYIESEPTPV
jgi:hypothetical protein